MAIDGILPSRLGLAFRTFAGILQDHPRLGANKPGITWIVPEGKGVADKLDPTPGRLPAVALWPQLGAETPMTFGASHAVESIIGVTIETAVSGTKWSESADLWSAIREALWPPDHAANRALYARMKAGGIMEFRDFRAASAINREANAAALARGGVNIVCWV